ncbi:hypothetical protein U0355_10325 [Salimicrobium sp. PL1-032A]|uniref:hypothetical protein n=1 Tax=Salimicrobium sp. PL1-032A TaxID=3095364 RepID=UPI00326148EC
MHTFLSVLTTFRTFTLSFIIVKEYYPGAPVIADAPWSVLVGLLAALFILEAAFFRSAESVTVSYAHFTYLFLLLLLVNVLPGSDPEAAFSMDSNHFIFLLLFVLIFVEGYQPRMKRDRLELG